MKNAKEIQQNEELKKTFHSSCGKVYWITGLAGAGKTSLGKLFYNRLKKIKKNIIFLDGDALREVFQDSFSYTSEERFKLAMKYARLCHLLSSQGMDVICATISMFEKCREWNRTNIFNYFEIYIRVPLNILKKRDQKKLFSQVEKGNISNVLGMDLPFEEPKKPDLIIENDNKKSLDELCDDSFKQLLI